MAAPHWRLIWLTLFSIAMAHVEAALVVHLRTIYYADNPLEIFPLVILSQRDLAIELAREAATLVMLLTVALLAEKGFIRVLAAFFYVFGLWDICYYLWLKLMIGWPQSWLEWDVLFLIPWPWFGPWITPAMIALIFVCWGGWTLYQKTHRRFTWVSSTLVMLGIALSLTAFLLPGAALLPGGTDAFRNFRPAEFPWFLFAAGYLLLLVGLWRVSTKQVEQ